MAANSLLTIMEDVAGLLGCLEQGTLTASSNTALTAATYPFMTQRTNASNKAYEGAEILTTSGTAPNLNPNGIAAYAAATGVFTPAVNYTTAPASNATFDIFTRGLNRRTMLRNINRALRRMRYRTIAPLTLVDDGDMEDSGVTLWGTLTGTGTFVKLATTTGNPMDAISLGGMGIRFGRLTHLGGANVVQPSGSINVDASYQNQWYVEARVRANTGTATLISHDVSNSADISSTNWTGGGWGKIGFQFTLPSTCRSLRVHLQHVGTGSSIGDWDNVILLPLNATSLPLPDWIVEESQLIAVYRDVAQRFELDREQYVKDRDWRIVPDESHGNIQFRLSLGHGVTGPMWIEAERPYAVLSADTDTTFAEREWVAKMAAYYTAEEKKNEPGTDASYWRQVWGELRRDVRIMNYNRMSMPVLHMGFSSPPDVPFPVD